MVSPALILQPAELDLSFGCACEKMPSWLGALPLAPEIAVKTEALDRAGLTQAVVALLSTRPLSSQARRSSRTARSETSARFHSEISTIHGEIELLLLAASSRCIPSQMQECFPSAA